jgi:hypothetical protein
MMRSSSHLEQLHSYFHVWASGIGTLVYIKNVLRLYALLKLYVVPYNMYVLIVSYI